MGALSNPASGLITLLTKAISGGYVPSPGASSSSGVPTSGKIALHPIVLREAVTISALVVYVSVLVAGKSIRLGVYADDAGVPGGLLYDAGTASFASTGGKEIALSVTLPAGRYWLAFLTDSTATGAVNLESSKQNLTQPSPATALTLNGYQGTQAWGALPAALPALSLATVIPSIFLKVP